MVCEAVSNGLNLSFDEVLQTSDIISLHLPSTPETRHIIGVAELKRMKPTAYFVNTSRGLLVDENALQAALQEEVIAGAALDVLQTEPFLIDHPFLQMENVILTPHISFYSNTSIQELKTKIAQYVVAALEGKSGYPIANPEVTQPDQFPFSKITGEN